MNFDSYSTNAINEFVVELVANHGDLYKLTEEELVKKYQIDGDKVIKQSVFKHEMFREYKGDRIFTAGMGCGIGY